VLGSSDDAPKVAPVDQLPSATPAFSATSVKRPVVIVVVQTILAEVRNVEIRPTVILVVSHGYAETPAIIGDASLLARRL